MAKDCDSSIETPGPCVTAARGYHPGYLAAKHRISVQQARDLLAEVGPDRERLNQVANVVRIASGR